MREVRQIYRENNQHWVGNGFLVTPLFSHTGEDRHTDPFLMLDYAKPRYFEPNHASPNGVGHHPHKGFETVTIAYQGEVAHRDSAGGGGIIRAGDVQWMTAGAGIAHDEFHSPEFSQTGGMLEMVQLWINLPAKDKNTPPRYQHLAKENIPVVPFADNAGFMRIIAGKTGDIQGTADTFTEMNVWDIVLEAGKSAIVNVPVSHQLSMVVLRGQVNFNHKQTATEGELVSFSQTDSETDIILQADGNQAKLLLLSGVPINEPIVSYGPFVMNTEAEIIQAFNDYRYGRFGKMPA